MVNFGRFVCVLVPFVLTLASLAAMMLAGLAGITDKGLYMFHLNVTELSIDPLSIDKLFEGAGITLPGLDDINIPKVSEIDIFNKRADEKKDNITAVDLGMYDVYDINIWNYCYTMNNGTRGCLKPTFNWATKELNVSTADFSSIITSTGYNVTLPKELREAVKAFGNVSKWTQVVFIIACIALGVELFFGLFANCSRAFSCVTWLISFVATIAVGAAAGLATATAVVIVGAVEATAKLYGADAHFNKKFLAVIWLGFALALAAGLFWSFTICCCAPDHGSSRRSRSSGDAEKSMAGGGGSGYQRLSEPGGYQGAQGYNLTINNITPQQQSRAGAYEPYSQGRA